MIIQVDTINDCKHNTDPSISEYTKHTLSRRVTATYTISEYIKHTLSRRVTAKYTISEYIKHTLSRRVTAK
jgi:hypothetical protein